MLFTVGRGRQRLRHRGGLESTVSTCSWRVVMQHPFAGLLPADGDREPAADELHRRRSVLGRLAGWFTAACAALSMGRQGVAADGADAKPPVEEGKRPPGPPREPAPKRPGPPRPARDPAGAAGRDPARLTTEAVGEEGGEMATTQAVGEEGGGPSTRAAGEEGGGMATTEALHEEGGGTTRAVGEEGGGTTTRALSEEGRGMKTTEALGEEGGGAAQPPARAPARRPGQKPQRPVRPGQPEPKAATTLAIGEEGGGPAPPPPRAE